MTVLGIDLGTSHSSLAFIVKDEAKILDIPQLGNAQDWVKAPLLPSVFFHDPKSQTQLPWDSNPPILGRYAREQAIVNPERAITSAKSWLCYRGDLSLPPKAEWGGKTAKEVSTLLLTHLLQAYQHSGEDLKTIDSIALTVPASFDPVARQLTEEAARLAGLSRLELIEEPLAAFYAWLAAHPDWNKKLKAGDSVLVCDVGGGTSDFSLIIVSEQDEELRLDRIAVGRHLLLGGDNMDLTLAHYLAQKHGGLDHWQFVSLQEEVRKAKEKLLSDPTVETYAFSVASRGSSLFASTQKIELHKSELESLLIEGFFPVPSLDEPIKRASGLQAMGLPYEADPAITKHLGAFLRTALKNVLAGENSFGQRAENQIFRPTHVLFNGGVFKAKVLEERVLVSLQNFGARDIEVLVNPDLDHAVTLGAAYFAHWKNTGSKLRVRTAAPRSYFVGIEANAMSVPGLKPTLQGLCVLPLGTEEGSVRELNDQEFALWGGDEVRFKLFSDDKNSTFASLTPDAEKTLEPVAELRCQIDDDGEGPIPVLLEVEYDNTGTLGLKMKETKGSRSWQLSFDLRDGV